MTTPGAGTRPPAERRLRGAFLLLALMASSGTAFAQQELGELGGKVSDPGGSPAAGAQVVLLDHGGAELRRAVTDASGGFVFRGVAPGSYYLKASSGQLVSALRAVVVGSALAVQADLSLAARTAETLVVTPGPEHLALATRTSVSGDSVRLTPARLSGRGLHAAVADTAGWATEDNGLLHARGVDDGFLFVIDGVPLYERFDVLFGIAPEPALVSSLNVITGHLPAEFGLKAGGVIEVNTAAGVPEDWSGAVESAIGGDDRRGGSGRLAGPLGRDAVLGLHLSGESSDRFLDPVHPDNLHNRGSAYQGDARVRFQPSSRDSLAIAARYGRSDFDVPHGDEQEEAGQDQEQEIRHAMALASWQRNASERTVFHLAAVGSLTDSDLFPSPQDAPLATTASRSGNRFSALGSVTHGFGRHVLKGGFEVARTRLDELFSFYVTDEEDAEEAELSEAALEFDEDDPFAFSGRDSGVQASAYIQDTWSAFRGFVLNVGVRFDRSPLPSPETFLGPRIGAAYRPKAGTTLRASVNRYFQPPQPEYLLLASSEQARALSPFAAEGLEGGAEPRAERQTGFEVGWEQWLGRSARLDLAVWHRRGTNAADPNVLFGTTIVFPNSVARGRATGFDVRLDVPRVGDLGGHVRYTLSKVDQYGPINGGLFLEENLLDVGPGTRFTPDHDQRHVAVFGLSYERAERLWLRASGRYESGTPLEADTDEQEELRERPGFDRVDLGRGRVKPRFVFDCSAGVRLARWGRFGVEAYVEALNLFDAAYAFNFGNPFSGTHFGAPRTFAVKVRFASLENGR
jgi:hypothetical protein